MGYFSFPYFKLKSDAVIFLDAGRAEFSKVVSMGKRDDEIENKARTVIYFSLQSYDIMWLIIKNTIEALFYKSPIMQGKKNTAYSVCIKFS